MKTPLFIAAVLLLGAIAAGQQASSQLSPFACNRSALTSTARKRHFDELGPARAAARLFRYPSASTASRQGPAVTLNFVG